METKEILKNVQLLEIKTKGIVNQIFSGEYHSVFKGRGMDFAEVREYQIGDDIRCIDWNVTARFGHPYVKVFEEERELTVFLIVDLSGSEYFGTKQSTKHQLAIELSATLAFSALKNNDKVGLLLFTDKIEKFIPPKKSRSHILRIIRELVSFEPEGYKTDINQALEFFYKAVKKRCIVFLISDFIDDNYERMLRILGNKHDLVAICVEDEKEKYIPDLGLIKLKDLETLESSVIDSSSENFKELLNNYYLIKKESQRQLFSSSKVDFITINTESGFIKPMVEFFKMREKRK